MEKILLSKYARRTFFFISLILFIILLLIRLLLMPALSNLLDENIFNIINTMIDALFSTGVSTVVIASLAFWLTPRVVKKSQMEIVEPKQVKDYLERARETDEYWFMGGTGRFTRSKTIPKLAIDARHSNFSKKIHIIMINPENRRVCEKYVDYRNKVKSGLNQRWNYKKLKKEILSTIVAAYTWRKEQPLLEVEVGLIEHYSLFRIDLSTELAVITKEDPSEPALMCEKGTFFFKSYLEDLRLSLSQSRILTPKIDGIPFSKVNGEEVQKFVESLGIETDPFDIDDFEEMAKIVIKGENPYGY
ncbi:hypothetical protein Q7A53_17125 [Halobacillus rhizosphaerae]|uniref:hypothetical protein n=1 Tax=Halobacillus rhizosphaerae TaxID=3064889 RepID=UPI00398B41FE